MHTCMQVRTGVRPAGPGAGIGVLAPSLEGPQGRRPRGAGSAAAGRGAGARRARALRCLRMPQGHHEGHVHMPLCWVRLSHVPLRPPVDVPPDRGRAGDFDVSVIKSPP